MREEITVTEFWNKKTGQKSVTFTGVDELGLNKAFKLMRDFVEKQAEYECYVMCSCQMDAQDILKKLDAIEKGFQSGAKEIK